MGAFKTMGISSGVCPKVMAIGALAALFPSVAAAAVPMAYELVALPTSIIDDFVPAFRGTARPLSAIGNRNMFFAEEANGQDPTGDPDNAANARETAPTDAQSAARTSSAQTTNDPDNDPEKLLEMVQKGTTQSVNSFDRFDAALGHRQIFSDLRSLQADIAESQRPIANFAVRQSTQSDDVDIFQAEVSQDLFFSQGRSQLGFGLQALKYTPATGNGVSELIGGLTGRHRIDDLTTITGEVWLNRVTSGRQEDVLFTYDVFLTLRPTDYIRIDLDTSRRTFDNITSLQKGITAQSVGGSIDFSPNDAIRLTLRGGAAFYSDNNTRQSAEGEAVWRIKANPVIEVGARATYFHFSRLLNNGYFNPDNYVSGEAMFRLQSALSKKLTLELTASGGIEHADPGGSKPLVKGAFQMNYKINKGWTLEGAISYFSSRDSNSSGFSRTSATLSLHYRF